MASRKIPINHDSVIELRKKYPCLTITKIAEMAGCSDMSVHLILVKNGVETRRLFRYCKGCFSPIYKWNNGKSFCSKDCHHNYYHITVECDNCGKLFDRIRGRILHSTAVLNNPLFKGGNVFCSRKCQGVWAGNHYGTNALAEYRKYDTNCR